MGPTFDGFVAWVRTFMGAPASVLPDDSPFLPVAYNLAISVCLSSIVSGGGLDLVPAANAVQMYADGTPAPQGPSVYAIAVYNLAGDWLVRIAQDQTDPAPVPPPANAPTFWADLRKTLGVGSFAYGLIQSTSDQGTSSSLAIPQQVQDMTLANMMQAQTPWGRAYLAIVGQWGTIWGIS